MEQGQVETKINLEGEIETLRREVKIWTEKLGLIKKEFHVITELIAGKQTMLESVRKDLEKVTAEISTARLSWANEKTSEMDNIKLKNSEADNIIKLKGELNKQQEDIRQETQKNTDVLNENRRLEQKLESDKLVLENKEKTILNELKELETAKNELAKDKENFKQRMTGLLDNLDEI